MGGRPVLNEDLVNLPNWLVLKLRLEGADAILRGSRTRPQHVTSGFRPRIRKD
jgi:trehalose/maltose hydrolase-like predicted phosphorylase